MKGGLSTMEAQMNIRRNAMEMQEYLQDLKVWEETVRKKDKELKKGRLPGSSGGGGSGGGTPAPRGKAAGSKIAAPPEHMQTPASQMHPDPRMRASKPAAAKKKKKAAGEKPASAAAHTYDNYRSKWEKFDVDAALAEADADDAGEEDDDDEEEESPAVQEDLPPIRKPLDADGWRSKGNEWFKMGDFRQAKDCYSSSIEATPNALAFANRAMACLKLGEHRLAEEDCTAAIGLDPLYLKSWQRRGAARKEQGRLEEATADYEMALRLQPSSSALCTEFQACFDALQSQRRLLPLRRRARVPVRVADDEPPAPAPAAAPVAAPMPAGPPSQPVGPAAPLESAAAPTNKAEPPALAAAAVPAEPGSKAVPPVKAALHEAAAAKAAAAIRMQQASTSSKLPPAPKSATEFERTAKSLSGDPERLAQYVKQLRPAELPAVFKSSLSTSAIGFAAQAVAKGGLLPADAGFACDLLTNLTKCDRFSMTAMLMSRNDKAAVKEALDGLQSAGIDVGSLRKQYKA